jgi:hypothetical protein
MCNDSVNTFPRQRIRMQQSDNFRSYATRYKYNNKERCVFYVVRIYPLLGNGCVFYGSASRLYKHSSVEAGSNTSTVTLRVVGGDKKGSLKCERVQYGRETQGARTKERLRWKGPAAYIKVRPALSSERAPHKKKKKRNCHTSNNYMATGPTGARCQE